MRKASNWIWLNKDSQPDEHVEFWKKFTWDKTLGSVTLRISIDSNFGVFLNGKLVDFGQYPDFPHYKIYEKIDLTPYVQEGENELVIEGWYMGENTQTYFTGSAKLWFQVECCGKILAKSDESVLARLSPTYLSYRKKYINRQIGMTYLYDATKDGEVGGYTSAVLVDGANTVLPRPVKRLHKSKVIHGELIKTEKNRYLFDFSREEVGVFRLRFKTSRKQNVKLCWGEHIVDGWVRDIIDQRDFSIDYVAKDGGNDFTGYLIRLGMRYIEIRTEEEVEDLSVEIVLTEYPLTKKPYLCKDSELQPVYDVCERTLTLCMHDHYEDCPWREQALYALDSRNQMLCGYYAFGEYEFARASLKLMSEDRREDGLLSICAPAGVDLTIPSFSLHYFTEVREYCDYSGDWEFAKEIYAKLLSIMEVFTKRQGEDGLVRTFEGENFWNFYEWSDGLSSEPYRSDPERVDVVLNALLSIALQHFGYISDKIGKENDFVARANAINNAIVDKFLDRESGFFYMCEEDRSYSELAQCVCVLCGAADRETAQKICQKLTISNDWTKLTLSMKCFKYDTLLMVDKEKYRDYVLADIKTVYYKMLDKGATSVWETEIGESDFDNAGSLCHGWSALPVYYLHVLKG